MQAIDVICVFFGSLLALLALRLVYCVWYARRRKQAIAGLLAGSGFSVIASVLFQTSYANWHSGCGCHASASHLPSEIAFGTSLALVVLGNIVMALGTNALRGALAGMAMLAASVLITPVSGFARRHWLSDVLAGRGAGALVPSLILWFDPLTV